MTFTPEQLMQLAIAEAKKAESIQEVPIGCVIWHEPSQRIIGNGHNTRHTEKNPVGHAEIIAIQQAAKALNDWRLEECTLAVTLEPCPMCAGAIVNARIPKIIYGCADAKAGAVRTLFRLCDDPRLNHQVQVIESILADECANLLRGFFQAQRALGKNGRRHIE